MKKIKQGFIIFLVITLISSCLTITSNAASITRGYSITEELVIGNYEDDYYIIKTPLNVDNTVYVYGKTSTDTKMLCIRMKQYGGSAPYIITTFVKPDENGEFYVEIGTAEGNSTTPAIIDGKGSVVPETDTYDSRPGYRPVETMSAGYYRLTIARATTDKDANVSPGSGWYSGPLGGHKGYCVNNVMLIVKSGDENNPKLIKYKGIISNNETLTSKYERNSTNTAAYKGSYVRYKNKNLSDMSFVLFDPDTGKSYSSLGSSSVNYLVNTAKKITAGAETDYEKALKIYEYVAENFYYDKLAFSMGKNQYSNPQKNLYNLRNKVASKNSTNTGKVAMVCTGYAAMVVALARASDIPARLVRGKHLTLENEKWTNLTSDEIRKSDHWWSELWIDGRWVFVDACAGTNSNWSRTSFSDSGSWNHNGLTNYNYFDPTVEFMSNNYYINSIYAGATGGQYANNYGEVSRLQTFLKYTVNGMSNGKRLNSNFSALKIDTWGNGKVNNFTTDGYGRVNRISWGGEGLYGKANFTNFTQLKYLTLFSNKLSSINLDNCTGLVYLSANYNKLTTFDSTDSKSLKQIYLKGNKLTNAKFIHKGKTITITSNYTAGNFNFTYDDTKASGKITIYAGTTPKGYKYLGIYNLSTGKRITTKTSYSFNPTSTKYGVKYQKI